MADVLIVDEDPEVRTMLGWYLAVLGHEVRGACSATEALDAITSQSPDAIILDVELSGMSGHDLLSVVHSQCLAPDASVVVQSARNDNATLVRSWELGASVHLSNPVAPEAVAEAVARHLAPRSLALAG